MSTAIEILAARAGHESYIQELAEEFDLAISKWITVPMVERMIMRQPVNLPRHVSRKRQRHWKRQVRRSWIGLKIDINLPKLWQ